MQQSPIEALFWNEYLIFKNQGYGNTLGYDRFFTLIEQFEIRYRHKKYRVDFYQPDTKMIIELDGYAFHETPLQATKDKIRQNHLIEMGYKIFRYSGKQVVESSFEVFEDVYTNYIKLTINA